MFTLEAAPLHTWPCGEILNHQLMFWEGSAKVLPAGFLTPFCEHFQPEQLGGKRERLPRSQSSQTFLREGGPLRRKVTDGFSAFAILDTARRNHRLSGKPELHLPTQSPGRETALSPPPPIGARVTLWSEQLEHCLGIRKALEPLNLKSFVCAQVSLGCGHLFS